MQRESGHSILITVEEMDMVKASRRLSKRKISIKVERKMRGEEMHWKTHNNASSQKAKIRRPLLPIKPAYISLERLLKDKNLTMKSREEKGMKKMKKTIN